MELDVSYTWVVTIKKPQPAEHKHSMKFNRASKLHQQSPVGQYGPGKPGAAGSDGAGTGAAAGDSMGRGAGPTEACRAAVAAAYRGLPVLAIAVSMLLMGMMTKPFSIVGSTVPAMTGVKL